MMHSAKYFIAMRLLDLAILLLKEPEEEPHPLSWSIQVFVFWLILACIITLIFMWLGVIASNLNWL